MNEKLLLLGVSNDTAYAIEYARERSIYTIVTDYTPPEKCPEKLMADEYWMIDLVDMDALEAKCREEKITGVYAGNSEFSLDRVKVLTERLGLPFYASDEGWKCARDKGCFKEHCMAVGVDVPKRYNLCYPLDKEELKQISYPAIVKPADSCCTQGLTICHSEEELIKAYDLALQFTKTNNVIVEDFIEGEEVDILYFIQDGEPILTCINDKIYINLDGRLTGAVQPNQSKYTDFYKEEVHSKVVELLKHMNCEHGAAFFQAIIKDNRFYFLEFGYRIVGIGNWVTAKALYGYSSIENMVDFALGHNDRIHVKDIDFSIKEERSAIYLYWADPGKIAEIRGLEEVQAMEGIDFPLVRYQAGDEIPDANNMFRIVYYIAIWAENEEALYDKIRYINETLQVIDENGKNLLIPCNV